MSRNTCAEYGLHKIMKSDPFVRRMYGMGFRPWGHGLNLVMFQCRRCHSTLTYEEQS